MSANPHALNWFEIPVADFGRAKAFYEQVLGGSIHEMAMGPTTMGFLPHEQGAGVGGALIRSDASTPSQQGTMVYLNAGDDLAPALGRVEAAGGTVVIGKTDIGSGFGFFAHFIDTEGNKVGLHSMR